MSHNCSYYSSKSCCNKKQCTNINLKNTNCKKKAYIYAYNDSLTQNINSCDQQNKIINFNADPIRRNIEYNGSNTFVISIDGTYEAIYSVSSVTSNESGILSYKILKNGIVVSGSVYSTNSEPNVSDTVNGNVKFNACRNDVIQLVGNMTYPSVISSSDSPFENKTTISGTVPGNSTITVNSPAISTKANSSVYVTVSNQNYCSVTSITDGSNNYTKASEGTFFNGSGIVQIWYLDGVPESNAYVLSIDLTTQFPLIGDYRINIYNIAGTENPSLDAVGTLNPVVSPTISNNITSTKKNDLAIMTYGRISPVGIITAPFPNFLLDSTPITADIYQVLGDIGIYTISATINGINAQNAISVAIKFADNQSVCDLPVNASIDLKLL